MAALDTWIDYWNECLPRDGYEFAITNVVDDMVNSGAKSFLSFARRVGSTLSFMKVVDLVELADLLLPPNEEEHHHEQ